MLNSSTNYPILTTRRITISKGSETTPGETTVETITETITETVTETVTEEIVAGSNPFDRRVDIVEREVEREIEREVEREVITTTPSTIRKFTKVKIDFLLKTQEPSSLSRWLSEAHAEYAQYLKVYFFVLNDETSPAISFYQDIETRYPIVFNPQFLYFPVGGAPIDTASISFSEILQNNFYVTTPVSDLSEDYYHDIYGEIEIELSNINLGETDNLHLIGLIHMDAFSYLEDNGISRSQNNPHPIESRGGNLVYDLLLKRGSSGELEVPIFREVFYVNQPTEQGTIFEPYFGPYHYHDESNPGPDNYIGWMAGHPDGEMGPRLESRRIRNYKVISSIFDMEQSEIYSVNSATGFPSSQSGNVLESYVSSILDESKLFDSQAKILELIKASDFIESQNANNFMKISDIDMSYISSVVSRDPSTGELTNETSHHASVVGVDFYRLVRSKSNYGDILNFHYNNENFEIVKFMLRDSHIVDFVVLRERVTNNPYSFNHIDGLDYKTKDLNVPRKKLVNTKRDGSLDLESLPEELPRRGKLIPASSQLASISEIDMAMIDPETGLELQGDEYDRYFCIKDYDLFHNVQAGKYRYHIKMTVRDGVYIYIQRILNFLKIGLKELNNYRISAARPVIRSKNGTYIEGSYDTRVNDFHESFKSADFSGAIFMATRAYQESVTFLTGRKIGSEISNIQSALDPRATNLETLDHFYKILSTLSTIIRSILKRSGDGIVDEKPRKKKSTYIPASGVARKCRYLEVDMKCPGIISAISEGALLANYSNYGTSGESEQDTTPNTPNLSFFDFLNTTLSTPRSTADTVVPISYLKFASSPYVVRDFQSSQGTLQPSYTLPADKSTSFIFKTTPTVVSSYDKFKNLTGNQINNEIVKINIMRSSDSVDAALLNKSPSFLINKTFFNAGVTIAPVKNLATAGIATDVRLEHPSTTLYDLSDLLRNQSKKDCFSLTDELKAALQAAAFNGVTRDEVIEIAEKNYEGLLDVIKTIDTIYDGMIRLAGSLQGTAARLSTLGESPKSEMDKFMEYGPSKSAPKTLDPNETFGIDKTIPYESERSTLMMMVPGKKAVKLNTNKYSNFEFSDGGNTDENDGEKYVFVKMVSNKKDAIVPVNNGYLLRI